jgi:hypothetical protein
MRSRVVQTLCIVFVALWTVEVSAEGDEVSGFVTEWSGELSGRVTNEHGRPLRREPVYVTTESGERSVTTDDDGNYRIDLGKTLKPKLIFVRRIARITGRTGATVIEGGEEVLAIEETIPAKVMPKSTRRGLVIPEYSESARDSGAWIKTWLMLDVDRSGVVTRIKFLNPPGYDLAEATVRAAFKESFAPARDGANRPIAAKLLWSYEWPSYEWMYEHRHSLRKLPSTVNEVPCREQSISLQLRDCRPPDLMNGAIQPWILPVRPAR